MAVTVGARVWACASSGVALVLSTTIPPVPPFAASPAEGTLLVPHAAPVPAPDPFRSDRLYM